MQSQRILTPAMGKWQRAIFAGILLAAAASGCGTEEPVQGDSDEDSANDDADDSEDSDKPDDKVTNKPDAGKPAKPKDAGGGDVSDDEDPVDPPKTGDGADAGAAPGAGAGGGSDYCKVQEILDQRCTSCHDGAGTGGTPKTPGLKTYADLTAPAPVTKDKKFYEAVAARVHDKARPMPPKNPLTAEQLALIDSWVAAGAPKGDATCAPVAPPPAAGDGFDESKCDEVYQIRAHDTGTEPYTIPAGGEIHPQIRIDAPWGDEEVQAIGFRPFTDNKEVLHHWILNGSGGLGFLAGWAPGDDARPPFPDDVGMQMPKGKGSMVLDMHYYPKPSGASVKDSSGVDVCVLKKANFRPKKAAVFTRFMSFGAGGSLAPAGANMRPSTGTCNVTATEPVTLLTAGPHAHKYARHMKFTVKPKSGAEIVMHDQEFKFGEQGTYKVNSPVVLNTGDVVTTTCYYTNETNRNIPFGESTESEMCFNFALYYPAGALSCGGLGGLGGSGGGIPGFPGGS
jgi:hypothetical protein